MQINRIMVVGAGQMGSGIAQVAAVAGLGVILTDISKEYVDRSVAQISKFLAKSVEKGKITEEAKAEALSRIEPTVSLDRAAEADLVIEAVTEAKEAKRKVFETLSSLCRPEAILASNTSSLPITELASYTRRPDRFIGMHFMNPVPLMSLVEVIRGIATSDETFRTVRDLAVRLGKTPVEVQDYPGFVLNRILIPMINEAAYCLMEGVAGRDEIDTCMRLGANHPMGPLALADLIGLDTVVHIMEVLYDGFGDPKYRPCPLLKKMVGAGRLGKKSGRGFYEYQEVRIDAR